MLKIVAQFLLLTYLFSVLLPAEWREAVTKLPELFQHFQEHRVKHPEFSFVDFLNKHYGEGYSDHQEDHDHSNLPGKSHHHSDQCVAHQIWSVLPPALPELQLSDVPSDDSHLPFFESQNWHAAHLFAIWQPPKRA